MITQCRAGDESRRAGHGQAELDILDDGWADDKGRLTIETRVPQLAPHVWVVDLEKFLEGTGNGSRAPSSPDAFVIGGLLIPFGDLLAGEANFVDAAPLTQCA